MPADNITPPGAAETPHPTAFRAIDLRKRRAGAIQLSYRLHVAVAIPVLLLLGAYLRIVFAVCAAGAWVKRRFKASQARMPEDDRDNLWW